jgi:hypothetical protein
METAVVEIALKTPSQYEGDSFRTLCETISKQQEKRKGANSVHKMS